MPSPQQTHTRINLGELKSQIGRKLGPERAQRYFSYLNRLLSQKLSKSEFNKLCFLTLGRENIHLHNQLIRSILRNAYFSKSPPPLAHEKVAAKQIAFPVKNLSKKDDGFGPSPALTPPTPVWSNGDMLPPSPRRVRSAIRERRAKDRSSSLGPNCRADVVPSQTTAPVDEVASRENGSWGPCDLKRPLQHQQGRPAEQPVKRHRTENLAPEDHAPVHGKSLIQVVCVDDRDEQSNDLNPVRGPLKAPLGIPFCPASIGGARRPLLSATNTTTDGYCSSYESGELCHIEALRRRMEKIAEAHGLGGVTKDCANILNNGVNAYLRWLVNSCVELVGARSRQDAVKQPLLKQQQYRKPINGVWPGNHSHVQSSLAPSNASNETQNCNLISLKDFKVAMELNPQQLGEDWPVLLEKISLHSFEE